MSDHRLAFKGAEGMHAKVLTLCVQARELIIAKYGPQLQCACVDQQCVNEKVLIVLFTRLLVLRHPLRDPNGREAEPIGWECMDLC